MTRNLRRTLACALTLAGLAAPAAAHEGEDHGKKPAADASAQPTTTPPDATQPKFEDPNLRGADLERRAARRRKLADEEAAKQKEAAGKDAPAPTPLGAPPGIGPK